MTITGTGLEITGLTDAKVVLKKQKAGLLEIIRTAMEQGAGVIEGEAKRRCPVDTGRLRASITTETSIDEDQVIALVGTNVEYATAVEYGTGVFAEDGKGRKTPWKWKGDGKKHRGWHTTSGYPAKPFLRPAYESRKLEAMRVIAEHFKEKLKDK